MLNVVYRSIRLNDILHFDIPHSTFNIEHSTFNIN